MSANPILTRRRLLGAGALGAGGLVLSGCDRLNASPGFRAALQQTEGLHSGFQRLIGGDGALAREFTLADMSPNFRVNGNSTVEDAAYQQHAAAGFAQWALVVDGLVRRPLTLPLTALQAMPQRSQITDRKSTRLNSSHERRSRMPSSA